MSQSDNFLARWSRRKREAKAETQEARKRVVDEAADGLPEARAGHIADTSRTAPRAEGSPPKADEPAFDLAKLPPIESIGAATDIRPFLTRGVPAELTRAALRRAWAADPAIRDYIGLAENAWDFTRPETIPGFGPLQMSDEVRRMVVEHFGGAGAGEKSPTPAVVEGSSQDELTIGKSVPTVETAENKHVGDSENMTITEEHDRAAQILPDQAKQLTRPDSENVAMREQKSSDQYAGTTSRRGHGGALPT